MSKSIDERVVKMSFDNKEFESGAKTSLETIRRLKESLNFSGAKDSLGKLTSNINANALAPLSNGIESAKSKFTALEVMGVTALANITNSAVNAGKRVVSAFTIDPVKSGFQEYETQINAIQTILANTESKGTTLKDVTKALDELNLYADKTIYNFTQMTRNIGTFTAAGLSLETSTSAIQGIANMAAVSGSTSQQASVAMYQLSQALASGTVKLQDWNSVVNAGMGGQVFQDALKATSRHMVKLAEDVNNMSEAEQKAYMKSKGYTKDQFERVKNYEFNVDQLIKKNGSFRESLSSGWITAEVLSETLNKMTKSGVVEYLSELTGVEAKQIRNAQKLAEKNSENKKVYDDISKTLAKSGKITAKEAKHLLKMADTAEDAATKVKTFTQLKDTLAEAAQSGWTQSWEYIIGDFKQAKNLWSIVSDTLGAVIAESADARNKLLKGWSKHGGRDSLLDAIFNIGKAADSIRKPMKKAFSDIFPKTTYKDLIDFTNEVRKLASGLILTDVQSEYLRETFKGLFSVLHAGKTVLESIFKPIIAFLSSDTMTSLETGVLSITAGIGKIFQAFDEGVSSSKAISGLNQAITGVLTGLSNAVTLIGKVASGSIKKFSQFFDVSLPFAENFLNLIGKIAKFITSTFSIEDVMIGLVGGNVFVLLNTLTESINTFTGAFSGIFEMFKKDTSRTGNTIKEFFGDLSEGMSTMVNAANIASVGVVALALSALAKSVRELSEVPVTKAATAATVIGLVGKSLVTSYIGTLNKLAAIKVGVFKTSAAMLGMIEFAQALSIVAEAMLSLDKLKNPGTSLLAFTGIVTVMTESMKRLEGAKITFGTGVILIGFATFINQIAEPLKKLGEMSWEEIARSLTSVGTTLLLMNKIVSSIDSIKNPKSAIVGAASIFIIATSLKSIGKALISISSLSWDDCAKGIFTFGTVIASMGVVVSHLGKMKGGGGLVGAVALKIISGSLMPIAEAIEFLGNVSWENCAKGIFTFGTVVGALAVSIGYLGKIDGYGGLVGAIALKIVITTLKPLGEALDQIGDMSWEEIGKSLLVVGGVFGILAVLLPKVLNSVSVFKKLSGLNTLLNSAGLLMISVSFVNIANALNKLSKFSWQQIAVSIVGIGAVLLEMTVCLEFLSKISAFGSLVGAAALALMSTTLIPIAECLNSLSKLSWEEIAKSVLALGIVLSELAIVADFLGATPLLALVGGASIKLLTTGLGDLANAFVKLSELSWEQVKMGLTAMTGALGALALGGFLNSFALLGDLSISIIAKPLGDLADSIKKWKDVRVPEHLADDLDALADGVSSFILKGLGAKSLEKVAPSIGILAESLGKWKGIEVPEGIEEGLKGIASGVAYFTLDTFAASGLNGSISGLGELAGAIKKWKGVTISEKLTTGLTKLSDALFNFTMDILSGESLSLIAEPLGVMAESVSKWKDVEVPDSVPEGIKKIADAISNLSLIGAKKISKIGEPLNELSKALNRMAKINGDASGLEGLCNNVKKAVDSLEGINVPLINTAAIGLEKLAGTLDKLAKVDTASINKFVKRVNNLNNLHVSDISVDSDEIKNTAESVSTAMKSVKEAITNSKEDLTSGMNFALSGLNDACKSNFKTIKATMKDSMKDLISSIDDKRSDMRLAFVYLCEEGRDIVKANREEFVTLGGNLAEGLCQGINNQKQKVYTTAFDLGKEAVRGEKNGQESKSPSKATRRAGRWLGEGLIIGMNEMSSKVYKAGSKTGMNAAESIREALEKYNDPIGGMDLNPTIKPVVDLSEVQNGANRLNAIFRSSRVGVGAGAIGYTIENTKIKNDENVIGAINDLKDSMSDNSPSNIYNVNGITYDDGSNISSAVKDLITAARIGRRV